jgi:hypothetical protein
MCGPEGGSVRDEGKGGGVEGGVEGVEGGVGVACERQAAGAA